MKNWKQDLIMAVIAIIALAFIFTACSKSSGGSGGGKNLNSATELKEYLDKQPANSPDNPIKIAMKANEMMIEGIAEVIKNAGKYVSLDLSGSPLTEIPDGAFARCTPLAGIIIPNGVTSIGNSSFFGTSLTSVNIPNGITSIRNGSFKRCTNLANVSIPNSVISIIYEAFSESGIASITIPNGVTEIGFRVFADCTNLASVTFQGMITKANLGDGSYSSVFNGDLEDKFLAGGIGTYTTTAPVGYDSIWTKQ